MKVLFIAATVALASASFAPSCEECNAAAGGPLASQLRSKPGSSSPKFALRLLMPLLVRRGLPPGGLTWPTASTPPSLELVTLASVSVFARRAAASSESDLRRLHRRHDQGRRVHEGARHHRTGCRSPHW